MVISCNRITIGTRRKRKRVSRVFVAAYRAISSCPCDNLIGLRFFFFLLFSVEPKISSRLYYTLYLCNLKSSDPTENRIKIILRRYLIRSTTSRFVAGPRRKTFLGSNDGGVTPPPGRAAS